ncbi:hypothetical protein M8C21_004935, partial [Ambrosia artemisiifolia]
PRYFTLTYEREGDVREQGKLRRFTAHQRHHHHRDKSIGLFPMVMSSDIARNLQTTRLLWCSGSESDAEEVATSVGVLRTQTFCKRFLKYVGVLLAVNLAGCAFTGEQEASRKECSHVGLDQIVCSTLNHAPYDHELGIAT